MKKIEYKCLCGHNEGIHNFDPDSVMFGCLYSIMTYRVNNDGSPTEPEEESCKCREFRPDTLRYVEDLYAHSVNSAK